MFAIKQYVSPKRGNEKTARSLDFLTNDNGSIFSCVGVWEEQAEIMSVPIRRMPPSRVNRNLFIPFRSNPRAFARRSNVFRIACKAACKNLGLTWLKTKKWSNAEWRRFEGLHRSLELKIYHAKRLLLVSRSSKLFCLVDAECPPLGSPYSISHRLALRSTGWSPIPQELGRLAECDQLQPDYFKFQLRWPARCFYKKTSPYAIGNVISWK